ncbi:MAG: molybdopterin molybdotransferase MoeA [Eubacteriales bacterium]|nr:molybdopterin molybdotransferase MoeA [Eubacteriales bacterium]
MSSYKTFVSFEEAVEMFIETWPGQSSVEMVATADALHRVTARDYVSTVNVPVVRASMMDGVAFSFDRFQTKDMSDWRLGEDFVRADTGDDFPDQYDTVLPIEAVRIGPSGRGLSLIDDMQIVRGMNIRPCGSLVAEGAPIVPAGRRLTATDLAALAMGNVGTVAVRKRPVVAFIPTGSELVSVGTALQRGQNVDANSILAEHLLRSFGAEPVMYPVVRDEPEAIMAAVRTARASADIVIVNGGSSKGEEDFGVRLQAEYGRLLFHWSEAGPGRPVALASVDDAPVIVVPGPVYGCFNVLHWFLYPIIRYRLQEHGEPYHRIRAVLTNAPDAPADFRFLCGVRLEKGETGYQATLLSFKQDGTIPCLTADGFVHTIPGVRWHVGDEIEVNLLRRI